MSQSDFSEQHSSRDTDQCQFIALEDAIKHRYNRPKKGARWICACQKEVSILEVKSNQFIKID